DINVHCRKVTSKSGYAWECYGDAPKDPRTGKRKLIKRRAKTHKEAKERWEKAIEKLHQQTYPEFLNETISIGQLRKKCVNVYASTRVKRGSLGILEKEVNSVDNHLQYLLVTETTHHLYQNMLIE